MGREPDDCITTPGDCITTSGGCITTSGYCITTSGSCMTAPGSCMTVCGSWMTASDYYMTASDYYMTASGYYMTASDYYMTASDYYMTASGYCSQITASLITASGSLSRRQILADILTKHCKTANISRKYFRSYRIRLYFRFHVTPKSNCMALMAMHLKYENFMALSAKKVPDL